MAHMVKLNFLMTWNILPVFTLTSLYSYSTVVRFLNFLWGFTRFVFADGPAFFCTAILEACSLSLSPTKFSGGILPTFKVSENLSFQIMSFELCEAEHFAYHIPTANREPTTSLFTSLSTLTSYS